MMIVTTERACLSQAAAVVSLTYAAAEYLSQACPAQMVGQRVAVIPTCADLNRFVPSPHPPVHRVIGCLGTVLSGWFRLDWFASFLSVAARRDPKARFELTTRDDSKAVLASIGANRTLHGRFQIAPCPSDQVQKVLQGQVASVMFFTDGLSKLGSSPTRMGEVLGCGLPVVANEGVGDVAKIIRDYRVGVLVAGSGTREMEAAWDELQHLLADPDLPSRCRKAAEEVFSLETGIAKYLKLYGEILGKNVGQMALTA
jgi:glycosyltransferase involved in cell wall biosynthesis